MSKFQTALAVALLFLLFGFDRTASAGSYGKYTYDKALNYGSRIYTYKHKPSGQYHHHVAVYRKSQPKYVYYYNSQKKKYWGRMNLSTGRYALLPDNKKTDQLLAIQENDFLPEGNMPKEGEGSDENLLPPPLPPEEPEPQPMPLPQPMPYLVPQPMPRPMPMPRPQQPFPYTIPGGGGGCHGGR